MSLHRHTAILGGGTLLSRLLGFLRDLVMAYALGPSRLMDAFLVAFRLANFARRLLAEGGLALAFLPFYMRELRAHGQAGAFALVRAALPPLGGLALTLALLGFIFAQPLTGLLAPGFGLADGQAELAAFSLRICLFYLPLCAMAALFSAGLLGLGKPVAPSLSTSAFNFFMLAGGGLILFCAAGGHAALAILSCSVVIGGLAQCIIQLPPLFRSGFALRGPRADHCRLCPFLRRLPLSLLSSSAQQLGVLVTMYAASWLAAGSISALYIAERLFELPLGLTGVSTSLAALPELARLQKECFMRTLRQSIILSLVLSLPAALGLALLARPIVSLLFGHGAFTEEAITLTSGVVTCYALGLPAAALSRPLLAALNALGMTGRATVAALASLAALAGLSYLLAFHLYTEEPAAALALAAALATALNTFLLAVALYHGMRGAPPAA